MKRRAGTTFLEVTVTSVLVAAGALMVYRATQATEEAMTAGVAESTLAIWAQNGLDAVSAELRQAGLSTITGETGSSITFRAAKAVVMGFPVYGTPITIRFEYDPQETDNGLDDDRDALVDEGRLVKVQDGETMVLCPGVQEGGFVLARTNRTVGMTLTLETIGERGKRHRRTFQGTIVIRN